MLYNLERKIKRDNEIENSREYKDLVYDLESFLIDMSYPLEQENEQIEAKKQEHRGKIEIANAVINELEQKNVVSLIHPVLIELGIPQSIKGFRILESCVLEGARMYLQSRSLMMMEIYSIVASQYNITAHNAERLCRYACDYVNPTRQAVKKFPFLEPLTHRTYENVTVKELVDLLVEYSLRNCRFRSKYSVDK